MSQTQSATPALEIKDLVKVYGSKTAVNGISLTVSPGTILAFLGPNGAGKTTTIEICEGFTQATSGSVRVLGLDPNSHADEIRRRVGIMLQGGGSYSGIKVGEMLRLAASYNEDPLDPEWLMTILGLKELEKTTYRRLSGGQQQRLSLALALIGRPELVFLDEPTAGMDAQSRLLVWKMIEHLRSDGVTVVLTTHLMDEAEALADNVVIIDHGVVVASGTTAELRDRYKTPNEISFSTSTPFSTERAARAGLHIRAVHPLSYVLQQEPTPQIISAIADEALAQGVQINNLSTNNHSLEQVFLSITGRNLRS